MANKIKPDYNKTRNKYKTYTDKRKFASRTSSCANCNTTERGPCCVQINHLGDAGTGSCPPKTSCFTCYDNLTECECAKKTGQNNCTSSNQKWIWSLSNAASNKRCSDCPCQGSMNSKSDKTWQVNSSCLDIDTGGISNPIPMSEKSIYYPYDPTKVETSKICRCGCGTKTKKKAICGSSSENTSKLIDSIAPVHIRFVRSSSFTKTEYNIYDKYSERFRYLNYRSNPEGGNTQTVRWHFNAMRFAGDENFRKNNGKHPEKTNRGIIDDQQRFDNRDLILRIQYVPDADIPEQPRHGLLNGMKRYNDNTWNLANKGEANDVSATNHIINIPLNKEILSGSGDISIPIMRNYSNKLRVLKFTVNLIDVATGKPLSRFRHEDYTPSNRLDENAYNCFVGYRDCSYKNKRCYSYETDWDSLYIVCDGSK